MQLAEAHESGAVSGLAVAEKKDDSPAVSLFCRRGLRCNAQSLEGSVQGRALGGRKGRHIQIGYNIADGYNILSERSQDLRAVAETDHGETAPGKGFHDHLNVFLDAIHALAALVVLSPHTDGGIHHKSDVQVVGADLRVRAQIHGPQANADDAARHACEYHNGCHFAGEFPSRDASAQDKISGRQNDQHKARGEHIEPHCRKICVFGGSGCTGDLALEGLDVCEDLLGGQGSAGTVELAACGFHGFLHLGGNGHSPVALRVRGIDAEYSYFVKGAHARGVFQRHKRVAEKFRPVV